MYIIILYVYIYNHNYPQYQSHYKQYWDHFPLENDRRRKSPGAPGVGHPIYMILHLSRNFSHMSSMENPPFRAFRSGDISGKSHLEMDDTPF